MNDPVMPSFNNKEMKQVIESLKDLIVKLSNMEKEQAAKLFSEYVALNMTTEGFIKAMIVSEDDIDKEIIVMDLLSGLDALVGQDQPSSTFGFNGPKGEA